MSGERMGFSVNASGKVAMSHIKIIRGGLKGCYGLNDVHCPVLRKASSNEIIVEYDGPLIQYK